MDIILIRHGESYGNLMNSKGYKLCIGQWNCELTDKGIEQAKRLKNHPLLEGAEAFFVSDLTRTQQTARAITEDALILDRRLRERSLGVFEGRFVADLVKDPEAAAYFSNGKPAIGFHDFDEKVPNGENYRDVIERVRDFLKDVQGKGFRKIVVVSHACTIQCFLKLLKGLTEEETLNQRVPNCEPIAVSY